MPHDEMYALKEKSSNDDLVLLHVAGVDGFYTLLNKKLSDFPENLTVCLHNVSFQHSDILVGLDLSVRDRRGSFSLAFDAEAWKHPWSIKEFKEKFEEKVIESSNQPLLFERNESIPNFSKTADTHQFVYDVVDAEIEQIITDLLPFVTKLTEVAMFALDEEVRSDALIAYFNFSNEVAVACEQYLIYFVQFLKDLGVGAEADLRHEAGQLLFLVKPDSQTVALEQIREALSVYLQLPANPGIGQEMISVGDIQAQQLISNVQHLQGQLRLAYATIQQQNMTINQGQLMVMNQAGLIRPLA